LATYAIGDVQGCFENLERLLEKIEYDPVRDFLWLTGDLVNRGPDSLAVLRWAKTNEDRITVVLGNHDIHLLAVAYHGKPLKPKDTLRGVLEAPDREDLLNWLRHRPLIHKRENWVLVHAGLLPQWSVEDAIDLGREVENCLRSDSCPELLNSYHGALPKSWSSDLTGVGRVRVLLHVFTRLRVCSETGEMDLHFTGPPDRVPDGYRPWYSVTNPKNRDFTFIFGHWAAHGLMVTDNVIALDSGCVWGNSLSAIRLEDRRVYQVPCKKRSF
jgi:bis(5'-nucleosyl)-tetraphosphatase (symmetrical)